jgi:hypothetical protein
MSQYEQLRAVLVTQFGSLNPSLFRRASTELQRTALEDALHEVESNCVMLATFAHVELEGLR